MSPAAKMPDWLPLATLPLALVAVIATAHSLRISARAVLLRIPPHAARGFAVNPDDLVRSWWAILLWPPAPLWALRDLMKMAAARTSIMERPPVALRATYWRQLSFAAGGSFVLWSTKAITLVAGSQLAFPAVWQGLGAAVAAVAFLMLGETLRALAKTTAAP